MSSTISLVGSVRTCKVDQGWANKVQSDRFENPNLLLCPIWDGMDTYGRYVNPDSFYTKAPGCSSAEDRVDVENDQRPKYFEYVTLDASGLNDESINAQDATIGRMAVADTTRVTGKPGDDRRANVIPNKFNINPSNNVDVMANASNMARQVQGYNNLQRAQARRNNM